MSKKENFYIKIDSQPGIYKHKVTGRYQATKKVNGVKHTKTFKNIREARHWRSVFNGERTGFGKNSSTLKEVWDQMQEDHFPTLAESTKQIWLRRYDLLQTMEHLPMHRITPSVVTSWVQKQVKFFKSDEYVNGCRGEAKRCNLDNELNLFTTIFNWYKESEKFEVEAMHLLNPIKTKHKKLGFIRPRPVKNKSINLDHALKFFTYLKPLYRDLALLQYYTASRVSEVAGLQWHRIDFDNRTFTIMETCRWDMSTKTFVELNKHPKNKEPRPVHMTEELFQILKRREKFRIPGNDFVLHVEGSPLNYSTIQLNYREAQRKGNLPYSGTHILRHGMAKLARKVGGGLDAVVAMTGHKDFKLADHYSKLDKEFQQEISEKIMDVIREKQRPKEVTELDNVISIARFAAKS